MTASGYFRYRIPPRPSGMFARPQKTAGQRTRGLDAVEASCRISMEKSNEGIGGMLEIKQRVPLSLTPIQAAWLDQLLLSQRRRRRRQNAWRAGGTFNCTSEEEERINVRGTLALVKRQKKKSVKKVLRANPLGNKCPSLKRESCWKNPTTFLTQIFEAITGRSNLK